MHQSKYETDIGYKTTRTIANISTSQKYTAPFRKVSIIQNDDLLVWLMVFNATFNTILAISWRAVLLVEETRPVTSH